MEEAEAGFEKMNPDPVVWDALILSGGRSSRMGTDKHLLNIGKETLLERTFHSVQEHSKNVYISGSSHGHEHLLVTWCREDPPYLGPVQALCSALANLTQPWVLILPCDLAHPREATQFLTQHIKNSSQPHDTDAFIARDTSLQPQWLTGMYRVPSLKKACANRSSHMSMKAFVADMNIDFVNAPADQPFIWEDMDTPEDYSRLTKEQT